MRRPAGIALACIATGGMMLAGVSSVLSGWGWSWPGGPDYERAPQALPLVRELERQRVTFLPIEDWCQALPDGSGDRANTSREDCTFDADGARHTNATTRARYETLAALIRGLPYDVRSVRLTYDPAGHLSSAQLALDAGFSRESLVYEPGHPYPVGHRFEEGGTTFEGIDADWYHLVEPR